MAHGEKYEVNYCSALKRTKAMTRTIVGENKTALGTQSERKSRKGRGGGDGCFLWI